MNCSICAVVFDMDDTLYDEMTFVQSGFRFVARYLWKQFDLDEMTMYHEMLDCLKNVGRGKIFDSVLNTHEIYDSELVAELIAVYRAHRPEISLYPDAIATLERLRAKKLKTGIITDGMHTVQKKKATALKLQELVDFIIYTDELGPDCAKPHPEAFLHAIKALHFEPKNILYIGNNPEKDILGANSVGMLSVHLCRGEHTCNGSCHASFHIKALDTLFNITTIKLGDY